MKDLEPLLERLGWAIDQPAFDKTMQQNELSESYWEMRRRGVLSKLRAGIRILQAEGWRILPPVDFVVASQAELDAMNARAIGNLKDAADGVQDGGN